MAVIAALAGRSGTLEQNVLQVFAYLGATFANARMVDPANTNNIISDDLTYAEKDKIKLAATAALAAPNWNQVVK